MDIKKLSRVCDSASELDSKIDEFVADLMSGPEQSDAEFEYKGHNVFGEYQNDDEVSLIVYVDDEEIYNVGSFDDDFDDTDEYWNKVESDLKEALKSTLSKISDSKIKDKDVKELFNECLDLWKKAYNNDEPSESSEWEALKSLILEKSKYDVDDEGYSVSYFEDDVDYRVDPSEPPSRKILKKLLGA